ncbi:hypothetical protein KI387_018432, partial [Taxus chinensis]
AGAPVNHNTTYSNVPYVSGNEKGRVRVFCTKVNNFIFRETDCGSLWCRDR